MKGQPPRGRSSSCEDSGFDDVFPFLELLFIKGHLSLSASLRLCGCPGGAFIAVSVEAGVSGFSELPKSLFKNIGIIELEPGASFIQQFDRRQRVRSARQSRLMFSGE